MTLLTSSILATEPLFDGVLAYFAPNALLHPETGLLRAVSYIARTASHQHDAANRIPIMASGAWFLSTGIMQLLAKTVLQKRAFLKTKLFNAVLLSIVFLRAALAADPTSMLSPVMTGLKAGLQIGNILWVISDMIRYFSATKDNAPRTKLQPNQVMLLTIHLMHGIASSIIMMGRPEMFIGGEGWGLWRKMSVEQNALDDISRFASKLGGVFYLTSAYSILDILVFDRSVERFAWWNTQAVITFALHSFMFLRAALTGGNEMPFKRMSLFNAFLVILSLKAGPTLFGEIRNSFQGEKEKKMTTATTTTTTKGGKTESTSIPGLSDEGIHPKKSL
ncbi:hypothetical protein FisN_4Lh140 [Fistulifera solaris]|uniref:Uncharacterized protein n=1 Tax=Fistulifera solaris TaxID=1519565 RepID=A0A1Z5JZ06_FISSO|nr:hypothetical protein FisN_4Lh140 [Fistulifera solaris]|eukprot:GAX19283.1 hypothetical protein FisN_4Lh140 [Fistulifera solaris]